MAINDRVVKAVRVILVIRDSYDIEGVPSATSFAKLLRFLFNLHKLKLILFIY
jgi:hypothetical protein